MNWFLFFLFGALFGGMAVWITMQSVINNLPDKETKDEPHDKAD